MTLHSVFRIASMTKAITPRRCSWSECAAFYDAHQRERQSMNVTTSHMSHSTNLSSPLLPSFNTGATKEASKFAQIAPFRT